MDTQDNKTDILEIKLEALIVAFKEHRADFLLHISKEDLTEKKIDDLLNVQRNTTGFIAGMTCTVAACATVAAFIIDKLWKG